LGLALVREVRGRELHRILSKILVPGHASSPNRKGQDGYCRDTVASTREGAGRGEVKGCPKWSKTRVREMGGRIWSHAFMPWMAGLLA
jgi:hypothetical protein